MILELIELIANYTEVLEDIESQKTALIKQKPVFMNRLADANCSETFANLFIDFTINSALSDNKIDFKSPIESLIQPLLNSDISFTMRDLVVLLKDLDHYFISQALELEEMPHRTEVLLMEILIVIAPEISKSKLKHLIALSDIKTIVSFMTQEEANQFMHNIYINPNLTPQDKDLLVFNPFFATEHVTKFGLAVIVEEEDEGVLAIIEESSDSGHGSVPKFAGDISSSDELSE